MPIGRNNRCFSSKISDDFDCGRLSIPVRSLGFRKRLNAGSIFWKELIRVRAVFVFRKNFGATVLCGEGAIVACPREEDAINVS